MRTDGRAELADGWKKSDDEIKNVFGVFTNYFYLYDYELVENKAVRHCTYIRASARRRDHPVSSGRNRG